MPHAKCVHCRVRFSPADEPLSNRCPMCGRAVQRAKSLEELVGFRRIEPQVADEAWGKNGEGRGLLDAVAVRMPRPDGRDLG